MILAFCVAAREFASMGRRLFSRRLGDIGTRSRLQTDLLCQRLKLDGRNSNGLAGRAWNSVSSDTTVMPSPARPMAMLPAAGSALCRPTVRLAELMLSLPTCIAQALACVGCQQDADGAIVNVVATISMQAAVVACGRQGSTRFSANYIHKRWLAPGVTTVPYVAEHRLTTALPMPRTGSSSSQFGTECPRKLQAGSRTCAATTRPKDVDTWLKSASATFFSRIRNLLPAGFASMSPIPEAVFDKYTHASSQVSAAMLTARKHPFRGRAYEEGSLQNERGPANRGLGLLGRWPLDQ